MAQFMYEQCPSTASAFLSQELMHGVSGLKPNSARYTTSTSETPGHCARTAEGGDGADSLPW
jgi:hypothetical protein